jgi:hypothetical protein
LVKVLKLFTHQGIAMGALPNENPLEIKALTRFLAELAVDFGNPKHVHLSYAIGNVHVNIQLDHFEPDTTEEETED